jgi:predicted nucleotidyltransferase
MSSTNIHTFEKLKKLFQLKDYDILAIFPYGSQVYGTITDRSDYDYIAVFKDGSVKDEFSLEKDNCNIHTYNDSSFQKLISHHKIASLECISLPEDKLIVSRKQFNFKVNLQVLRSSISEKASHSYVKSRKKMEVEKNKNMYIAKKSLFHSFRIIDFGKQIALNDKVINFSSQNSIWTDIFNNSSEDWKDYSDLYKEKYNSMMSEFRELAPKL